MRRAALRTFRTARGAQSRFRYRGVRSFNNRTPSHALGFQFFSSRANRTPTTPPFSARTLESSMFTRRASVALVSGLVGYGAWYTYTGPKGGVVSKYGVQQSPAYIHSLHGSATALDRKAVIIDSDNLYTSSIPTAGPLAKDTIDDAGRKVVEMLTPDQASQILRRTEESYFVGRGAGVLRYDTVQIPSNNPIEDDHAEKIIEVPSIEADSTSVNDWMFWGVFDGHAGWTTSAKLRQALISYVARELNTTYNAALKDPANQIPTSGAIDAAIKTGFNKLDHEIVHDSVDKVLKANSKRVAAESLAPALSGSCALLSFYDSRSKLLRVACTGDSRAVLGRKGESGRWAAMPLSVDQTGGNPDEEARMRSLHPGEPDVIRHGRVLGGLEPTRAFGDASYKWTRDISEKLRKSFFGRTPNQNLKTPPYVTAEPVVTTTKIEPEKGDFLVMATDGLWEMLSNEEVIGLVGQWIEKQTPSSETNGGSLASSWAKIFYTPQKGLPVEHIKVDDREGKSDGQKTPIRQRQWGVKGGEDDRFVVEDKNVATHLVRNALGGKDKDMVCALLTLPAPFSRRYRDDLTVEVIFFGQGERSGDVVVNDEATASVGNIKAKL